MRGYNQLILGEREPFAEEFSLKGIAFVAGMVFVLVLLVML